MKLRVEEGEKHMFMTKITVKQTDHVFCLDKREQQRCFVGLIKAKIVKELNIEPREEDYINLC